MKEVKGPTIAGAAVTGLLVVGGVAVAQGRGGGPRGPLPEAATHVKAGSSGV